MPTLDPLPFEFGEVSTSEAREFVDAVAKVLRPNLLNRLYFINRSGDGFALSFDKDWFPFIGKGSGFNEEKDREFLRDGVALVTRMVEFLRRESRPREGPSGGRYILQLDGVRRIDQAQNRIHIIKWIWPLSIDETMNPS